MKPYMESKVFTAPIFTKLLKTAPQHYVGTSYTEFHQHLS